MAHQEHLRFVSINLYSSKQSQDGLQKLFRRSTNFAFRNWTGSAPHRLWRTNLRKLKPQRCRSTWILRNTRRRRTKRRPRPRRSRSKDPAVRERIAPLKRRWKHWPTSPKHQPLVSFSSSNNSKPISQRPIPPTASPSWPKLPRNVGMNFQQKRKIHISGTANRNEKYTNKKWRSTGWSFPMRLQKRKRRR